MYELTLFFLLYAMVLELSINLTSGCVLQPDCYKWPPVDRSDSLSMSVTGGQLIYNAQLVNDDYYTQTNSTNFENWTKEKSIPYL